MEKKIKLRSLFSRMDFSTHVNTHKEWSKPYVQISFPPRPHEDTDHQGVLLSPGDETSKFQKSSHLFKCSKYKSSKLSPFGNQQVTDP